MTRKCGDMKSWLGVSVPVFFLWSDEILVLMLVMVCHFYVILWTWSMLKYDRDRFPFFETGTRDVFRSWTDQFIRKQMGFDQFLWFSILPSKMYEIIFTQVLNDILRTGSWFL